MCCQVEHDGDHDKVRDFLAKQGTGVLFDIVATCAGTHMVLLAAAWLQSENADDLKHVFTEVSV